MNIISCMYVRVYIYIYIYIYNLAGFVYVLQLLQIISSHILLPYISREIDNPATVNCCD